MTSSDPTDQAAADLNRRAKQIEKWPLMRASLPLMAASISFTVLYVIFGITTDVHTMLIGAPIIALGFVLSLAGYLRRMREIRSADDPNTRGYGFVFLGWACVVVGLVLPWYLVA